MITARFVDGPMDGTGRALHVPRDAPRVLRFMVYTGPLAPVDGFTLVGFDDVGLVGAPPGSLLVYELDIAASELTEGVPYGQEQGRAVYRYRASP